MCAKYRDGPVGGRSGHTGSILNYLAPIKGMPLFKHDRLNQEANELAKLLLAADEQEREGRAGHISELAAKAAEYQAEVYPGAWVSESLEGRYLTLYFDGTTLKQMREIASLVGIEETAAIGGAAAPPFVAYKTKDRRYTVVLYYGGSQSKERLEYLKKALGRNGAGRKIAVIAAHALKQRKLWEVPGGVREYDLGVMVECFLKSHPLVQGGCLCLGKNLGTLVLEFFQLYGKELNWTAVGIVPESGSFARRTAASAHVHLAVFEADRSRLQPTNIFLYSHVQELFEHLHSGMSLLLGEAPAEPLVSFWVKVKAG